MTWGEKWWEDSDFQTVNCGWLLHLRRWLSSLAAHSSSKCSCTRFSETFKNLRGQTKSILFVSWRAVRTWPPFCRDDNSAICKNRLNPPSTHYFWLSAAASTGKKTFWILPEPEKRLFIEEKTRLFSWFYSHLISCMYSFVVSYLHRSFYYICYSSAEINRLHHAIRSSTAAIGPRHTKACRCF